MSKHTKRLVKCSNFVFQHAFYCNVCNCSLCAISYWKRLSSIIHDFRHVLGSVVDCVIGHLSARMALLRRAVKRAGPSKKVWCSRLGSTKTRRFHLLTLELRFLKKLHDTTFYVNQQLSCCSFCSEGMRKGEFFRDKNKTLRWLPRVIAKHPPYRARFRKGNVINFS